MFHPPPPGGGEVSDDDNLSSPVVSDDENGGGLGRASSRFRQGDTDEDIFAPEIHVEDNLPRHYFAWVPGLINHCFHAFVGGWAYVTIHFLSKYLSDKHQRSTMDAIRAREEELHYYHYGATH